MASESQKPKEHPSTYIVQDRSNEEELTRLHLQDQLLNAGMGGMLPEQEDLGRFQRVLDVGCGTGNWLISLAQQVPIFSKAKRASSNARQEKLSFSMCSKRLSFSNKKINGAERG